MHVVVVVERVEKIHHVLVRGGVQFAEFLGDVAHLRGDHIPTRRFQRLGNMVEFFDGGQKARTLLSGGNFISFERFDFVRAGLDRIGFRVAVRVRMRGLDNTKMIEEKTRRCRAGPLNRP